VSHVLVMAKSPVPGRVKTRLCPPLSPDEAAAVAAAALADTLEAVAACSADRRIIALDGAPGPWLPSGFTVIAQRGDAFADRLAHAWGDAGGPGIQIGMDTPQIRAAELDALLTIVDRRGSPAVLGPALDGGWWVIGWRQADPAAVFRDVPMSTADTGRVQHDRLVRLGLSVTTARPLRDVDTIADLRAVACDAPATRTAAVADALGMAEMVA